MQQVADTLETLLAPGHRFRLSPLVEATQLAVEPFLHAVLGYFGLNSTEGGAARSSEPIRCMLGCLYYSSTGLPKRHGKREPQLLEEA